MASAEALLASHLPKMRVMQRPMGKRCSNSIAIPIGGTAGGDVWELPRGPKETQDRCPSSLLMCPVPHPCPLLQQEAPPGAQKPLLQMMPAPLPWKRIPTIYDSSPTTPLATHMEERVGRMVCASCGLHAQGLGQRPESPLSSGPPATQEQMLCHPPFTVCQGRATAI